jgi:hypothetical protein
MRRLQYVGHITELQGKSALTMNLSGHWQEKYPIDPKKHCVAQFDDEVSFNGKRMHLEWHPFLKSDFAPIGDKPIF